MSNARLVVLAIAALALFIMIGCEGDPGPAGTSGTATCVTCHNDDTQIVAIAAQWGNSTHANGGNYERNTPPCSGCHTSEGFVARMNTGDPGTPDNPSAIGCFTCHEPHTNYNFNLRISDPVVLAVGGATFDKGNANLCAQCHQNRTASPTVPDTGTVIITSSRWGPHHGPQANILSGNSAYVFAGETYTTAHAHYVSPSSEGCVTCHMSAPFGSQAGGHTWNMTYDYHGAEEDQIAGCETAGCHSTLTDFSYGGVQDSVLAMLTTLETLLLNAGIIDSTGLAVVPETLTVAQAGALYNFNMFEEDRSEGIHNPGYAYDVLNASITAMGGR